MRLPEQVEVFVFRLIDETPEFLMAHRIPSRGGFWQPLTGGVESTDASRLEAARREVWEETGIEQLEEIFEIEYQFEFFVEAIQRNVTEFVFAAHINEHMEIQLSDEHDDYRFVSYEKALDLMKYDTNKEALKKAFQTIGERYNISN